MYTEQSYNLFGKAMLTELLAIAEGGEPTGTIEYSNFHQVQRAAKFMFLYYLEKHTKLNAINERVWDTVQNLDEQMDCISRGIKSVKTSDGRDAHVTSEDIAEAFADLCKRCSIKWYCPSENGKHATAMGRDWENTDLGKINKRAIERSMFASALQDRNLIVYN